MSIFTGAGVAIVTPFHEDGSVNYEAFKEQIERQIAGGVHGTGDIYASAFTGAKLRGKTAYEAAVIAADFVLECIKETQHDPAHVYGARFEPVLGKLIEALK